MRLAPQLRRACLVVPATSPSKLARAATIEVDEVVIDLEDSVATADKGDRARQQVVNAIRQFKWRTPSLAVRVNAPGSSWFVDDIRAVVAGAGSRLDSIVIPKVEAADDILGVDGLIQRTAGGDGLIPEVRLQALIETAAGVLRVDEIAASSPRLEALVFGAGDFAASLGLPMGDIGAIDGRYPGDQWLYPRSRIAVAAAAYRLGAIDGPFADFRDLQGLSESAYRARMVGFTGKWAIHPDQVRVCRDTFSPSPAEIAQASRILQVLDTAGGGAAAVDGTMIDEASRRSAENIRDQGEG
jgi:citrate lyase subunit beta / citryl-CoA lyase